jgi:hypothetical protein
MRMKIICHRPLFEDFISIGGETGAAACSIIATKRKPVWRTGVEFGELATELMLELSKVLDSFPGWQGKLNCIYKKQAIK